MKTKKLTPQKMKIQMMQKMKTRKTFHRKRMINYCLLKLTTIYNTSKFNLARSIFFTVFNESAKNVNFSTRQK